MDWTVMFKSRELDEQLLTYTGKTTFKWLPLMVTDDRTKNLLGINDASIWVCGKASSLYQVEDPKSGFLLCPILGERLADFTTRLNKAVLERKLPKDILLSFPFDSIICAGIQGQAEEVNRAYSWVDQGYPVGNKVAECFLDRKLRLPKISEMSDEERVKFILSKNN